jgi:hypothetical protein
MSVSATAAVVSAVAATQAATAARAAHISECKAAMVGYQHDPATDAQMRQYTECVAIVYPATVERDETLRLLGKGAVILLFAGLIVGAIWGWRKPYPFTSRLEGSAMSAAEGFLSVAAAILVIGLSWAGIRFLLS